MSLRAFGLSFALLAIASPAYADDEGRLKLSGDLRLRSELDTKRQTEQGEELPLRFRPRVRFRLALDVPLDDEFHAGARLTTGDPDNPRSANQTLGEANQKFTISLDRVFMKYTPEWAGGMSVTAGKFGHPFLSTPIYDELLLDGDVQPGGAALTYATPPIDDVAFFLGVAHYLMLEQDAPENADVTWTAGQLGMRWEATRRLMFLAAVEAHFFRNPTADGATQFIEQNRGNRLLDIDGDGQGDHFESDFRLLQAFADLTYTRDLYPTLAGGYFRNLGADRDQSGWFAGASIGRGKQQYGGKLFVQVQHVGREAVFTPVSQTDFLVASGFFGVLTGFSFLPTDFLEFKLSALLARRDELDSGERGRMQQRYRADLTAKF